MGQRPTAYTLKREWVAQAVDFEREVESSKRLKIRVSVVRFRPRPPNYAAALLCSAAVFLCIPNRVRHCDKVSEQGMRPV